MTSPSLPVWFVTGCSTGFGQAIAREAIDRGYRVAVTARDKNSLAGLTRGAEDRVLALDLDLTDAAQIAASAAAAEKKFGRIDVLVNNAGYGYQTTAEEADDAEVRLMFETNVFGLFALTRAVLPGMRKRREGRIINMTSTGGLVGMHGSGYYAATKHAVEGWTDALRAECKPLGLGVTCVEPGPFRTDFSGRSLRQTLPRTDDYLAVTQRMGGMRARSGKQPGDPRRAAKAIADLAEMTDPPRHLVLGAAGYQTVTDVLKSRLAEIEKFRDVAVSADYPKE